jgi:2-hydroxy-6-oxonona-2,4-dienedioate hydrolase
LRMHALASTDLPRWQEVPVVLVHGLGVSSRYMVPIARHLAPDLQVFAPDLPGFGRSDKPDHVLTIRQLADALAAWMSAAGLRRAMFIGNSLGCEILVELALRHPERVVSLVLQGPTPEPAARTASQQIWRYIVTGQYERSPLSWVSASDYMICGVRRFVQTFLYMLEEGSRTSCQRFGIPAWSSGAPATASSRRSGRRKPPVCCPTADCRSSRPPRTPSTSPTRASSGGRSCRSWWTRLPSRWQRPPLR